MAGQGTNRSSEERWIVSQQLPYLATVTSMIRAIGRLGRAGDVNRGTKCPAGDSLVVPARLLGGAQLFRMGDLLQAAPRPPSVRGSETLGRILRLSPAIDPAWPRRDARIARDRAPSLASRTEASSLDHPSWSSTLWSGRCDLGLDSPSASQLKFPARRRVVGRHRIVRRRAQEDSRERAVRQ